MNRGNNHDRRICTPFLSKNTYPYSAYMFYFIDKYGDALNLGNSICDVGCGRMRHMYLFDFMGFKNLYACDRYRYVKDDTLKVSFELVDLEKDVPFQGRTFDVVICNHVFMFIHPDKRPFFTRNIFNLVSPGGYLVFEFYNPTGMTHAYDTRIEEALDHLPGGFSVLNNRKYGFIAKRGL